MQLAYHYIRVSGRGQVDGDGPDRQRDAIKQFCEAHGLAFAGEFFDEAVSGTKEGMDRPAFSKMLIEADIQRAVIVVERMDRLARDLLVSEMLLRECRTRGIKVFCADQGQLIDIASDEGDPTRKLIRQVLAAVAEWGKSELVRKLRHARERVKRERGRCEGTIPYGELPGETRILALIIQFHRNRQWSVNQIAEALNLHGFRTRRGSLWDYKNVYRAILNFNRKKDKNLRSIHLTGRRKKPARDIHSIHQGKRRPIRRRRCPAQGEVRDPVSSGNEQREAGI